MKIHKCYETKLRLDCIAVIEWSLSSTIGGGDFRMNVLGWMDRIYIYQQGVWQIDLLMKESGTVDCGVQRRDDMESGIEVRNSFVVNLRHGRGGAKPRLCGDSVS